MKKEYETLQNNRPEVMDLISQSRAIQEKDHSSIHLEAGDVIEIGDFFCKSGEIYEMDNLGRILGVRCVGETVKKAGNWFRPNQLK
jgi:hypothetical protein